MCENTRKDARESKSDGKLTVGVGGVWLSAQTDVPCPHSRARCIQGEKTFFFMLFWSCTSWRVLTEQTCKTEWKRVGWSVWHEILRITELWSSTSKKTVSASSKHKVSAPCWFGLSSFKNLERVFTERHLCRGNAGSERLPLATKDY